MTTARLNGGGGSGVAFLIAAGIVYEIVAACCSSPQTTEINAKSRASTLMKWVNLGIIQAAGFVLVAAAYDQDNCWAIIMGGGLAGGLLYGQYYYARQAGLASNEAGTESY